MSGRVERVVIVGRDAAAWLAALGLQRALGRTGVAVQVVELPSQLQPVDVYSAVPSLNAFHRLLGLQEAEVLARCAGVPLLGQRFVDWSGAGTAFLHGYDVQRPTIGDVDFLQFWVKARGEGLRVDWEDFSLAASAAKQGRVAPEDKDPESLANVNPGYHLHAEAYVQMVRQHALRTGVTERRGQIRSVERESDRITGLLLDDGEPIGGDFFVDASGAEAVLLGGQPGAGFESWSEWLGCDRLLAASGPPLKGLPAFSQITASRSGWVGLFPLQDRTAAIAAYDSASASDEEMFQAASAIAGMPLGDVAARPFRAGAQQKSWIGNCVALGEAAIALEPLDGLQLHGAHIGLSHLVALFPVDADAMPEAESYNASIGAQARNIRDFQIAHYRLNQRTGEPFWDRVRTASGPASLDGKLALFAARGQVPSYDDESFEAQNWASIFIGHGLMPRSYDPMVDAVPRDEQIEKVQRLLHLIAGEVKAMPTVADYLASSRS